MFLQICKPSRLNPLLTYLPIHLLPRSLSIFTFPFGFAQGPALGSAQGHSDLPTFRPSDFQTFRLSDPPSHSVTHLLSYLYYYSLITPKHLLLTNFLIKLHVKNNIVTAVIGLNVIVISYRIMCWRI